MARRHNDANVVTLSGARLAPAQADAIVERFLRTGFEGGRQSASADVEPDRASSKRELKRRPRRAPGRNRRPIRMPDLPPDFFNRPLAEVDPEIAEAARPRSSSASSARWR